VSAFTEERLAQVHAAVRTAIADRDPQAFSALYDTSAVLLPPDGRVVRGTGGAAEEFGQWLAAGLTRQTLENVELTVADTLALEEGIAVGEFGDDIVRSNYIVVHARTADGEWRMVRDMWIEAAQ
jgi:ketosteroid isomerase-like protein